MRANNASYRVGVGLRGFLRGGVGRWGLAVGLWLLIATSARADPPEDPEDQLNCGWDFFCHLKGWVEWLLCWFIDLISPLLLWMLDFIPEEWDENFESLGWWLEVANNWLPLAWAATLLGVWFLFATVFIAYKLVIKHLPWIG